MIRIRALKPDLVIGLVTPHDGLLLHQARYNLGYHGSIFAGGTGGYSDLSLWHDLGPDIGRAVLTKNLFGMTGFSPGAKIDAMQKIIVELRDRAKLARIGQAAFHAAQAARVIQRVLEAAGSVSPMRYSKGSQRSIFGSAIPNSISPNRAACILPKTGSLPTARPCSFSGRPSKRRRWYTRTPSHRPRRDRARDAHLAGPWRFSKSRRDQNFRRHCRRQGRQLCRGGGRDSRRHWAERRRQNNAVRRDLGIFATYRRRGVLRRRARNWALAASARQAWLVRSFQIVQTFADMTALDVVSTAALVRRPMRAAIDYAVDVLTRVGLSGKESMVSAALSLQDKKPWSWPSASPPSRASSCSTRSWPA